MSGDAKAPEAAGFTLVPTNHPAVSRDVASLWLAPQDAAAGAVRGSAPSQFAAAMELVDDGNFTGALPALSRLSAQQGPLGNYAAYFAALSRQRLGSCREAREAFRSVQQRQAASYLSEAAALAEAECAEALGDYSGAVAIYERMIERKTSAPEEVWMRLGNAAKAARDFEKAVEAYARVYVDFPLSSQAGAAGAEFNLLAPTPSGTGRFSLELKRAERLFAAGRYSDARAVFTKIASSTSGDERALVRLRLAEIDYHLKRTRIARDAMLPLIGRGPRQAEALYFYALALRKLGDQATYVTTLRRVVAEFPTERWAEEALDNLGTHYILVDDEAQADEVFRELSRNIPRAAMRSAQREAGWRSYRLGRYADVIPVFESAAASFPRSNYRPAWLYWSGRAYEHLENRVLADDRYLLTAGDYLNSYYGRLAVKQLGGRMPLPRVVSDRPDPPAPLPNEAVVRALLSVPRYDDALQELRYAQRMWGDSPAVVATISWIYRQQGESRSGNDQFTLLRGSITLMRRAYPQFMAAGGEDLPREVLLHIFPLDYWDLIRKHAARHNLDEYLVAALVAQESTFVPAIRSSAGAAGLMQLMPATGRSYARKLKLRVLAEAADRSRGEHSDGDHLPGGQDAGVRRGTSGTCQLQCRRSSRTPVDCRATGCGRCQRVHRGYSVPRDTELRETNSWHDGRLPPPVRSSATDRWSPERPEPEDIERDGP